MKALIFTLLTIGFISSCNHHTPPTFQDNHYTYKATVIDPDFSGVAYFNSIDQYLAWGTDAVIQRSGNGQNWKQADVLDNTFTQDINKIVEGQTPEGSSLLVALGEKGQALTSETGESWTPCPSLTNNVHALNDAVYLTKAQRWLGIGNNGLLITSTDPRKGWEITQTDVEENLLVISKLTDERVLIGAEKGLLASSSDFGVSWSLNRADIETPILAFHAFNATIIATSLQGNALLSFDNAISWKLLQTKASTQWNSAAYVPGLEHTVVAGHDGSILIHKAGNEEWQQVSPKFKGRTPSLSHLYYDSIKERLLAFDYGGLVFESKDGGIEWTLHSNLPYATLNFMVASKDTLAFVGSRGFKAMLHLAEDKWQTLSPGKEYYWRSSIGITDDTLLLGAEVGKLLRSEDAGETWSFVATTYPDPRTPPTIRKFISTQNASQIFAAGPTGFVLHSNDSGISWSPVVYTPFDKGDAITDIISNAREEKLIAIEAFHGPFISSDSGKNWQQYAINMQDRNLWFGHFYAEEKALLVGQRGLAINADLTQAPKFEHLALPTKEDLYGIFSLDEALFVFGADGLLLYSSGDLQQWTPIDLQESGDFRGLIQEPRKGNLILFGQNGALYTSQDAGLNWAKSESQSTGELRNAITEEGTGHVLLTGRDGTLLRSSDAGLTWAKLPTHTTRHFRGIAVAKPSGSIVLHGERIVVLKGTAIN